MIEVKLKGVCLICKGTKVKPNPEGGTMPCDGCDATGYDGTEQLLDVTDIMDRLTDIKDKINHNKNKIKDLQDTCDAILAKLNE